MTLGGIPLEVSARINHCHTPIDVTFLVQSETTLLKNFNPNDNDDDADDETAVAEVKYAESSHDNFLDFAFRGRFHKNWANGANHRDSYIHLCLYAYAQLFEKLFCGAKVLHRA